MDNGAITLAFAVILAPVVLRLSMWAVSTLARRKESDPSHQPDRRDPRLIRRAL